MNEKIKQDPIDSLYVALESADLERAHAIIASLHPAEIADIIEGVPSQERHKVWQLLSPELAGEVLSNIQGAVRAELLEHIHPIMVAQATEAVAADDAADILQNMPEDVADTILKYMGVQNRQRLASVLTYPEDTAGGLMDLDVTSVRADVSLYVVMRYLRLLKNIPEKTDNLMVIDRDNHYLGVLPLTQLLTQDPETTVGEYIKEEPCLLANDSKAEVAKLFEQRDLVSTAVVDDKGVLLGRITIDDVVDVIQKEADHTLKSMAGISDDDSMFSPIISSTRRRSVWLAVNLITAFLAAAVIGLFKDTIQQVVALAVLMPIVAGMGGVAGSQTLTMVIRGVALGQIVKTNIKPLLIKEFVVGVLNGIIWACVVTLATFAWFNDLYLGLIIGTAIIINLIIAALAGTIIPLVLNRYGIDPAISGNVVLTTITDIVGFITFLGLAMIFLTH